MSVVSIGRLLDLSSDLLLELDNQFRIVDRNAKARRYLGKEEDFLSFFPASYSRIVRSLLENSKKSLQPLSLRVPIMTVDGEPKTFYMKVIPVERGFFISLKPEKRSGLAEEIINSIDYGVILYDSRSGSVIYRNRYAQEVEGVEELIVKALKRRDETRGYREPIEVEVGERHYLVHLKPFSRSVEGYIILFRDITNEKRMQELMSLVDRLTSVGIMAAALAHEIKNPLASVKILAQTLAQDLDGEKRLMAQRISTQVDRVNDLISKLLFYSKPSTSRPRYIRAREVIEEVINILEAQASREGIEIEYLENDDVEVYVDPKDLQQILINLILNAIDACRGIHGCKIQVETGMSSVFADTTKKYAYIKVRDYGVGIPKEKQDKIFYPFYTTKQEGTGLGLYVVHKLVKDNGGIVEVDSRPGKGTTFTLYFKGRRYE